MNTGIHGYGYYNTRIQWRILIKNVGGAKVIWLFDFD